MEKQKLVVVVMGQNCEKFISMCLDSVKNADKIIFCDGGSSDETLDKVYSFKCNNVDWKHTPGEGSFWDYSVKVIKNTYSQEDPQMNGKQRNFYLNYLKENYNGWWSLCLDADEVVEDLEKIKEFINLIQEEAEDILFSPKMRHFMYNLGLEDANQEEHFVPHRLFKIREDLIYPEVEHPVLSAGPETRSANMRMTTIWHLAHLSHCFEIKKRYEKNLKHSNIHSKDFLDNWYAQHLFYRYPVKPINPLEVPNIICDYFGVNKDILYFQDRRQLETKHFYDAIEWKEFFKPKKVLECGCGVGQRLYVLNRLGVDAEGFELSKYAVEHSYTNKCEVGNIVDFNKEGYDLVIAYDVLEHLEYNQLDRAIENMKKATNKHILISVPYKDTINFKTDITHKIGETEEWWENKFKEHGLKRIETPNSFIYCEQILIFEK